ncbi:CHAT domain-containing protein [Rhodocollybia butyracea]|uniref:CHAT domain-containing protein n=1 Tax=Rhodocollybia butyracea TaxID=206335 RepID=A0A9P5P3N3_9AGAR|nr:CHAT domain-containing protein [Rhodocollybia butyracea]
MDHFSGILKLNDDEITRRRAALVNCPVGHPERAFSLHNLGVELWNRFRKTGHLENLEESIQLTRDALLLIPAGDPQRVYSLNSLSLGLRDRFGQTGHHEDLDESIQLNEDALLFCPVDHPQRGSWLSNLSAGLGKRFQLTGHLKDLNKSIQLNRDALCLHPKGHPRSCSLLINLSAGLIIRFQQSGHLEDLEESIQLNRDVLLIYPMDHPERGFLLSNLSAGLRNRFQHTGHLGDLNESIQLNRNALLLCPTDHPERGILLGGLSLGLSDRFQQTGHLEDLDQSIQLNRDALLLRPIGHPGHGSLLIKLSACLGNRFKWTGHLEDLEESIQLDRAALSLHPMGHPAHGASLINLSAGLTNRFQQTGHLEDLEESIQLNRDALLLFPTGHPQRGFTLSNLSVGLMNHFEQTGHLGDLEESIQLNQNVLLLCPIGHPGRGSSLNNLSVGLKNRSLRTGLEDLNEAIQLDRDALHLHPMGHPEHGSSLNNLSVGLRKRFERTGCQEDLIECLSAFKRAAQDIYSPLSVCLGAVKNWVDFTWHHNLAQSNLDAYLMGLSLISRSLSMMPIISLQYQHLSSFIKFPEFVSDGASQAIQQGQLALAVEIIEQGRGLLWSELRGLRIPMNRLQTLYPSLADELMQVNHKLERLSMQNSVDPGTELHVETDSHQHQMKVNRDPFGYNLAEKRHLLSAQAHIVDKIHKIPGFETFWGRKSFAELSTAAKHGPVIVVNCSRYRSDVLILLEQKSPVLICLGKGLYGEVETLGRQLTETRSAIKTSPKRYNNVLRATLKDLWDLIVSPVVTKLQELHIPEKSRIFWCPTSILSTLPLHAAGPILPGTKKFLPDLYISSYTPTITALIDAFNTAKSSSQIPHLLVASQYNESLPRTKEEIHEILQYQKDIPTTFVEGPTATKETLEKAVVDHQWLHIASHGTLIPGKPFNSYFSLAGSSRFTLLDIIRLNLPNATFAFLSACHTAEQSPGSVHNEVIHLAAAMQFCGFQSVVGTMWEMADIDGPEMVKDFYSNLFSDENLYQCNEVGAQARALAQATKKMRGRKGVTLERWVNFVHIGV